MYLILFALVMMSFVSTSAVIYMIFDKALERNGKGCDGSFFCHGCNYVVGYRRDGHETIIGKFVERSSDPPLPDNVIPLRRHADDDDV